jgi:ABC-type antimicrobial peptide transport system permease subunit
MSLFRLIARSLAYHRRLHFGLLVGVILACGILTGALLMGDSVDYSLREIASLRLGRIAYAMNWPNRFFAQDLAERLGEQEARIRPVAAVLLRGMASVPSGRDKARNQLNRVQVLGVGPDFWRFAEEASFSAALGPQEAAVSKKTALDLGVKAGDDVSLRVVKQGLMPLDAPLSSRKDERVMTSLVTVKAVLSDDQLGRFSLAANQTTPYNVFVERGWLQEQTGLDGLANLMLADDGVSLDDLHRALDRSWELEDIGLRLRAHASGLIQLESASVFVDEEVVRATLGLPGAYGTLTYLVNSIAKSAAGRKEAASGAGRMTPYSFVEAGAVPKDLRDDQAIISQWLAEQLGAGPGDVLDMAYLQLLPTNSFAERHSSFTVHSVVSTDALSIERELAPRFPGLTDVENCRDWSIGMPMDQARLNDPANEAYWRQYGQTPKLLVTLKAGQDMWANRFGTITAVRFPAGGHDESEIRRLIREKVSAEKLGLRFVPVRKMALDAVAQAMDFGGLFVGMSLFLIVAALILLGLLYVFGIQQRAPEIGLLLAVGFPRGKVRALFLCEACPTAVLGAVFGAAAGVAFARLLLAGLAHYWPGAVAGTAIRFHAESTTLLLGISANLPCVFFIVLGAVWRGTRHSAHELLTGDFSFVAPVAAHGKRRWALLAPTSAVLLAAGTAAYAWLAKPDNLTEPFFAIGTFLLLAGFGYCWWLLAHLDRRTTFKPPRLWKIALANLTRRRGRSLSVAGLAACGCFLVFAVSSMQENVALHADERSSGSGGFRIFAETTAPIIGTPEEVSRQLGVQAVPLKVRDGDDAGCLNLNHAQTPRLFGVDARRLAALGAFVHETRGCNPLPAPFVSKRSDAELWGLLDQGLPDGVVPALVGDTNTAIWGLKKKTGQKDGDMLSYRDESGREFKLKLAGQLPMRLSVFQGSLLISDEAFTRLFPSEAGFRAFLIDAPSEKTSETAARLNRDFERFGMEAVPAVQRLRDFYAVESAYLAMFLVLGGLGLVLGAGGVGVVVLRNVFERRTEIAIFHALGYERRTVFRVLFAEHGVLVLGGMALGTLAAAAAVLPLVLFSQTTVSAGLQMALLAIIVLANLVSVAVLLQVGLSPNPISDLRQE